MGGELSVGDYVTLQRGVTYKGRLVGKPGPALLGLGSIVPGGGFREGDYKTYGGDCPPKIMLRPGDLFASLKGATKDGKMIGSVARVPESVPSGRLTQDTVKLELINTDKETSDYLYWILRTPQYRDYCDRHATGSAVVALSRDDFLNYPVPPISKTRKKIVSLLEFIEYKVELNRQMNATLESMALVLFKSWFVDFDPVIDNALVAGNSIPEPLHARAETRKALGDKRKPQHEAIHKQFPSRFVFSEEMGWIPEGWRVNTLGEKVETTGGGTPSTKVTAYWEDGTHAFCTPKDMSSLNSMVLLDTERYLTDAGVNKISSGQLPVGTVLMSSRAPIGYLAISDIPVSVNQGIIAMLPNVKYGALYLLCWTRFNMGQIEDRANGSTFLEISKKNFRPIPFAVAGDEIQETFNDQAQSIYEKILLLAKGTRSLTQLRDTLLLKLLSGQLRVPDAEKLVADAV